MRPADEIHASAWCKPALVWQQGLGRPLIETNCSRENFPHTQKCFLVKLRLRMRYSDGVNVAAGQKMTTALVAIAVLAVLSAVRGDESDKHVPTPEVSTPVDETGKSGPVHVVSELVKKAFPYDPAAAQKKEETKEKEPDAQVVTMERFTVVESMRSSELEKKIKSENEKTQAEKFSVTKGGAMLKKDIGRTRVELGAWPAAGAGVKLYFLKLSW
jgi:hypothetical protein